MEKIKVGYKCRYCDEWRNTYLKCIEHEREHLHEAIKTIDSYMDLIKNEFKNSNSYYGCNGVGKPLVVKQLSWEGTSVTTGITAYEVLLEVRKTKFDFTFEIKDYFGTLYLADFRAGKGHLTKISTVEEGKLEAQSRFETYCLKILLAILSQGGVV